MFLECVQRHLGVCGYSDLPRFAKSDPDFWNLISILEPSFPRLTMRGFRKVHGARFYDVTGMEGLDGDDMLGVPRAEHIRTIFEFADSLPGQPLLVHCRAGVSRSAAVALAIIVRAMHLGGATYDEIRVQAPETLIQIRPQATPNPLVLELGFSEFFPAATAKQLMIEIVNHPVLFANRHHGGLPG